MKTPKQHVAIIIPAYNESKVIKTVIREVHRNLLNAPFNYQVIVVDDQSTDATAKISSSENTYVIKHLHNMGSGGATATGMKYARDENFDFAASIDADGQHDPKDLLKGIIILQNSDIDLLIGNRLLQPEGMPFIKRVGNVLLSRITSIIFNVYVSDTQSGLRIYSRNALHGLKWKSVGYEYCSEMIWRAKQISLKIDEFPIQAIYTPYSINKGQRNRNAIFIVKSLFLQKVIDTFYE